MRNYELFKHLTYITILFRVSPHDFLIGFQPLSKWLHIAPVSHSDNKSIHWIEAHAHGDHRGDCINWVLQISSTLIGQLATVPQYLWLFQSLLLIIQGVPKKRYTSFLESRKWNKYLWSLFSKQIYFCFVYIHWSCFGTVKQIDAPIAN